MITSKDFAHSHSSFWKDCFPALESYTRVVNSGAYERLLDEMDFPIESSRSFLISEVAFCLAKKGNPNANINEAYQEARIRLRGLPGVIDDNIKLTEMESLVATNLATRIVQMINGISGASIDPVFDPIFLGCGSLAKSYGDILVGQNLIEVKSVERGFRATDFRQLMTYVFQDMASGSCRIQDIALLNPRKGIFYKENIEKFVFDTSASSVIDVQNKFLSAVGFGGVSR